MHRAAALRELDALTVGWDGELAAEPPPSQGTQTAQPQAPAALVDAPAVQPAGPAPGWYPDPQTPGWMRYWDGWRWGPDTAPAHAPAPFQGQAPQTFSGPTAYNAGNHTTVVIQNGGGIPAKSPGVAVLLAFLFGPLGMLYSTVPGAVVMFLVNLVLGVVTLGLVLIITWPIGMVWAYQAAINRNRAGGQVHATS